MTRLRRRGNAVPETALVMSLVLLVLFGLLQMAVLAYQQAEGDAAAFLGARATVQNDASASTGDANVLKSLVANVFPHLSFTAILSNPTSATFETDLQQPAAQFNVPFLPSNPQTIAQNSRSVEVRPGRTTGTGNQLINYCATGNLGSNFGNQAISLITANKVINSAVDATSALSLSSVTSRSSTYASLSGDLNALPNALKAIGTPSAAVAATLQSPLLAATLQATLTPVGYTTLLGGVTGAETTVASQATTALNGQTQTLQTAIAQGQGATMATLASILNNPLLNNATTSALLGQLTTQVSTLDKAVNDADSLLTQIASLEAGVIASDPTGTVTPCPTQ